ncbi:MAG TPA: dihydroxyacetone kinase phosphoryl donor subunit DhaM [Actinocrinis sp.]|nr:dihydroxyacetone kinase phosphoryl donor subunit DhaM [Actinocrinis sp.]HEV2342482.1 dihydroxyacetone kinase phosphoryl donor subunit DhaM [Actinocrinis sp.]
MTREPAALVGATVPDTVASPTTTPVFPAPAAASEPITMPESASTLPPLRPLVGIVLVSHSALLAEGAAELARQLGGGEVPVESAGGLPDGGIGTSIELIEQAVRAADRGAGVVVLADLGSAVLTVRLLLDDADTLPDTVVLADAPFVEGAVSAAVAASSGANAEAVRTAAEEARGFRKL